MPPKPENTIKPTVESRFLDHQRSTLSVKSKVSFASKVMKSVSRSGSKDSASYSRGSHDSIRQDNSNFQGQVPLKKSKSLSSQASSKNSHTSKLMSLSHSSSRSTSGSMSSRNIADDHHHLEARVLPPRPEVTHKRKEPLEAIVATVGRVSGRSHESEAVECIYQLDDENENENEQPETPMTYSGGNLLHERLHQREMFPRATSAAPRFGKAQNLACGGTRDTNVLGEISPASRNASNVLFKDPKDIRGDISDLGMLSPKNIIKQIPEKENTSTSEAEIRKADVFDMFSSGLFCFRPDTTTSA